MKLVALILAVGACSASAGSAPETEWSRAWATSDCAPWDGAATSVFMTDAPGDSTTGYPLLRISVYHAIGSISGARWQVGESRADAAAGVLCPAQGTCIGATAGWVDFDAATEAGPLRGRYQLTMPDGSRLIGHFDAPVKQTVVLCG